MHYLITSGFNSPARLLIEGRMLGLLGISSLTIAVLISLSQNLSSQASLSTSILLGSALFLTGSLSEKKVRKDSFLSSTSKNCTISAYLCWVSAATEAILQLGLPMAVPYLLGLSGLLMVLSLIARDSFLEKTAAAACASALALYGTQWQTWDYPTVTAVVVCCYSLSIICGKRGKGFIERELGLFGYCTLLTGTYLLIRTPYNTATMAVEALALIVLGFATNKVGHRFSGVVAIFIACAKLWIIDLSGAGAGVRTAVGFAVFGVCSVTAGIFYLVEYVWKSKTKN